MALARPCNHSAARESRLFHAFLATPRRPVASFLWEWINTQPLQLAENGCKGRVDGNAGLLDLLYSDD